MGSKGPIDVRLTDTATGDCGFQVCKHIKIGAIRMASGSVEVDNMLVIRCLVCKQTNHFDIRGW